MSASTDPYEASAAILTKWKTQLATGTEAERDVEEVIQATLTLEQQCAERERAMGNLIAGLERVVAAAKERLGQLSAESANDAGRIDGLREEKAMAHEEIDRMMKRMRGYQESIKRLQENMEELRMRRQTIEADADFRTSKIRRELLLFSSISKIRWDYDVQDRFKGVKFDSADGGEAGLAAHIDLDASEVARVATTYQMWNMVGSEHMRAEQK
eukprot:TRINITY_DN25662_c0_g1_i1.p1 TRINITY_DN25662_c0_g1~~TRINITY_DN25662_c0_g1_i1.p1  ORF type:complete len:214 (-),score=8.69 TRINITY_DN25662_c0_g1_i1:300-941(-)